MSARYFPIEEYEQRWQRIYDAMDRKSLDCALVWSRSAGTYDRCADLLYLVNYYGNQPGQGRKGPGGFAAALLRRGQPPELFADVLDPRSDLVATSNSHGHGNTFAAVMETLSLMGDQKVALVGTDIIPLKYWTDFDAGTRNITWVEEDELIREVRLVKSAAELSAIREAGAVVSNALSALMASLVRGESEADAAGAAAKEVFAGGGHVHMLAVSHGPYIKHLASDPLAGFSKVTPKRGDLIRGWITGPMFQGYWLGPGRSAVVGGRSSAAQRALLEANARAVERIVREARPGVTVARLVEVGDQCTAEFGGPISEIARQWPTYGHGNGLFFERPGISTKMGNDADFVLKENMVISIEVFFESEGVGCAGFENNVIVTGKGPEVISTSPMFWD